MKTKSIQLISYATFLSGRSLPKEIISSELNGNDFTRVTLDFKNVPAANQSFLNQLFLELSNRGFGSDDVMIVNAEAPSLNDKIFEQINLIFDDIESKESNCI